MEINIRNEIATLTSRLLLERAFKINPQILRNKKFSAYYNDFVGSLNFEPELVNIILGGEKNTLGPEFSSRYGNNTFACDSSWEKMMQINKYSANNELMFGLTANVHNKKDNSNSVYSAYQSFGSSNGNGFNINQHTEYKDEIGNHRQITASFGLDNEEKLKRFNIEMIVQNIAVRSYLRLKCQNAIFIETREGISLKDDIIGLNQHTYTVIDMKELNHFDDGIKMIDLLDNFSIVADIDKGATLTQEQLFEYFANLFNGDVSIYEQISKNSERTTPPAYIQTYHKKRKQEEEGNE